MMKILKKKGKENLKTLIKNVKGEKVLKKFQSNNFCTILNQIFQKIMQAS